MRRDCRGGSWLWVKTDNLENPNNGGVNYDHWADLYDGGRTDRNRPRYRAINGSPNHSSAGNAAPGDIVSSVHCVVPSTH